ncbi:DUF4192 family protein, partial [Streptomyces sp. H27-C3]|uniref:DUF4192 family protein n=1 Tax=Streptomyces sp. H27-C3 TaxID=3046305 RepID=UPI0024BA49A0
MVREIVTDGEHRPHSSERRESCDLLNARHRAPPAAALVQRRSTGDEPGARVALGLALQADPDYHFAQLLHQACNEGIDPEALRRCLRQERAAHGTTGPRAPRGRPGHRHTLPPVGGRVAARRSKGDRAGGNLVKARPGAAGARGRIRRRDGRRGSRSGR